MRRMLMLGAVVALAGCGGQSPDQALDTLSGYCTDGSTGTAAARNAIATVLHDGSDDQKISAGLLIYCDDALLKTFHADLKRERR